MSEAEDTAEPLPHLLFVYGTLRLGSPSLMSEMLAGDATYVGEASVAGALYDTGRFPACVPPEHPDERVHGDAFALRSDTADALLAQLDQYEGYSPDARYGSLFVRESVTVRFHDGSEQAAWMYRYNDSLEQATRVPSGDWNRR